MRHTPFYLRCVFAGMLFFMKAVYALPFTIEPIGALPLLVPLGGSVNAFYSIKNNTNRAMTGNLVKYLPTNAHIDHTNTTCSPAADNFNLNVGQTCTLALTVSGPINKTLPNVREHLYVCMSDKASCAGPLPADALDVNVIKTQNLAATIMGATNNLPLPLRFFSFLGAYSRNGNAWVPSLLVPTQPCENAYLNDVSCSRDGQKCVMVGNCNASARDNHAFIAYASNDGGASWQGADPFGVLLSGRLHLSGIDCNASGDQCLAVGNQITTTGDVFPVFFKSTDAGRSWFGVPRPNMAATLWHVACDNALQRCMSVGRNADQTTIEVVSTQNGGMAWSATQLPPPREDPGFNNALTGLACDTTLGHCLTVLRYKKDQHTTASMAYYSNDGGLHWVLSPFESPKNSVSNELRDIGCSENGKTCIAVGSYYQDKQALPLVYVTLNGGGNWSAPIAIPTIPGASKTVINKISCDQNAAECLAVGYYRQANSTQALPLIYTVYGAGSSWNLSPSSFLEPLAGTYNNYLNAVNIAKNA